MKNFLTIFSILIFSSIAEAKVKLQCQGILEQIEKNIIYVSFDEKFIEIVQGSGGNKVVFEINTIDESYIKSWNRPLEKNAKHVIKSGKVLTYDTYISDWNEWYSEEMKDRHWIVYIDRVEGYTIVGHSKESYKNKSNKINIEWVHEWECKKYGLSKSKF